ncbi:hypothetical protein Glove_365g250 [Diversispora epigaea]|uniref:Uncharacterized protein n=1 Tax=Diversispora epigaea TaxID=1348612 RepID=A0A397H7S5_9GLOM|nr:hypothetical protein Glove_365g250 [Diversispora epigaea]
MASSSHEIAIIASTWLFLPMKSVESRNGYTESHRMYLASSSHKIGRIMEWMYGKS